MKFTTCDCPCHLKPIIHYKPCCPESCASIKTLTQCQTCKKWVAFDKAVEHVDCVALKPVEFKRITLPVIKRNE